MPRTPGEVFDCKHCVALGVAEPFRGTAGQVGRHTQTTHPKGERVGRVDERDRTARRAGSPASGPTVVDNAPPPGAGDSPADVLGGVPGEGYVRDDERVPGGATVRADGEPVRKPTWRERLWRTAPAESPDGPIRTPMSTRERKPTRKRVDASDVWTFFWRFAGHRLEKSEMDIVVGRCLVYQAPVAGAVLEELTKDTLIDKLIQPLARKSAELETAAALFMLPSLLGMLERKPHMAPVLVPMISDAIEIHLHAMVPIVKEERKKKAQRADALRELYPDAPEGTDPVELVLSEMFAGTVFAQGFDGDALAEAERQARESAPGAAA